MHSDDVLTEQAILKWYHDVHLAKGKSVFLPQMKRMVEWLNTAEEESDEGQCSDTNVVTSLILFSFSIEEEKP